MDSLVDGPVGATVVATLANSTLAEFRDRDELDETRSSVIVPSPHALLEHVGAVVEGFAYGTYSEWREVAIGRPGLPASYRRVEENISKVASIGWWWSPVDLTRQAWFGPAGAFENSKSSRLEDRDDDPNLWWVEPWGAFMTSRLLGSGQSVSSICRDGHMVVDEEAINADVPIYFDASRKIFEVSCAREWVNLVERFPMQLKRGRMRPWSQWTGYDGPWVVPDWPSVAEEFDGVHVQLGAVLSSSYRRLHVENGSTMLAGWNPDSTLWLK